ncbi:MAG: sigma-70 family RNA polymerase sigma factor [Anaerolineae bacterium]|nr:sigma-70 family RNA polymerase sigma factor [Anaerolineae bacterium]
MNQEEKSLVEALHRGDRYACDDLVQRYSPKIYNVALRLTGHPTEAEEVLQETFINACRGVEAFEGRSSLTTWLYRIATNNGLMRLRRREAPVVSLDTPPDEAEGEFWPRQLQDWDWNPEMVTLTDELRQVMDEAVAALPGSLQGVFVLRDLEGLSVQEVTEILGISASNVKVRLHRARLMLREHLANYFYEKSSKREN